MSKLKMLPEAPRAGSSFALDDDGIHHTGCQIKYVVPSPLKRVLGEIKSQQERVKLISALGKLSFQPRTAKLLERSFEGNRVVAFQDCLLFARSMELLSAPFCGV